MCVRVQAVTSPSPAYDPERRIVRVPEGLSPAITLRCVRAVMAELSTPQPALGARCWCGEPIVLDLFPAQHPSEVIRRGA